MTGDRVGDVPGHQPHPLEPLTHQEVLLAVSAIQRSNRLSADARFSTVTLEEPPKQAVHTWCPGAQLDRCLRAVIVPGPGTGVIEAVVAVPSGEIRSWRDVPGVRPVMLMEEAMLAVASLKADPAYQRALGLRGIDDMDKVQVDPWPAGTFGVAHEEGRRICRCISYLRSDPAANGYARPIEGVIGFVDLGTSEVLEVLDLGVIPVPAHSGSYFPEDMDRLQPELSRLEVTQPDGPGFSVDNGLLRWRQWSMRVSLDPIEGLVLHTIGWEDGGRVRPIVYRASVSEMVVPYGDPGPMHGWKAAFDAGEWGLGRMANSLVRGCDCLGEITYLDATLVNERGEPYTLRNAICIHEEDAGILWRHSDWWGDRTELRRSRRLVVSSIATVGNYDYGFYWYFYLDGSIELEVKLTGILSTMAIDPDAPDPRFAGRLSTELAAPFHQHLFNVRLDMEVDGPSNTVEEVDVVALGPGPGNPWSNAFEPVVTVLDRELRARRVVDGSRSRTWRIVNRSVRNSVGRPTAYKLVAASTPVILASPQSSVARRAAFASANLWVTRYSPEERRAGGEYPNQGSGEDGVAAWQAQDRSLVQEDVVLWHTFGLTHLPRPEDWPVMPVERTGFSLVPFGFFDRNPAIDLPPPGQHCG